MPGLLIFLFIIAYFASKPIIRKGRIRRERTQDSWRTFADSFRGHEIPISLLRDAYHDFAFPVRRDDPLALVWGLENDELWKRVQKLSQQCGHEPSTLDRLDFDFSQPASVGDLVLWLAHSINPSSK